MTYGTVSAPVNNNTVSAVVNDHRPYFYDYGTLTVGNNDFIDLGYMRAEGIPYDRTERGLIVLGDRIEAGWAAPVALPYKTVQEGGILVTVNIPELGFRVAVLLACRPYMLEEGMLTVLIDNKEEGFYRAISFIDKAGHLVRPYSTNVLEFLGVATPGDELVYGLELETLQTDVVPMYDTGKVVWKRDSTCWAEAVTKPMSFKDMMQFAMTAPIETLVPNEGCGMHLHINRKALTQKQICLIALLISSEEYASEIELIAGRSDNEYCKKVKKSEEELLNSSDRYEAVNLTNYSASKYTVEIRIFSSTNSNKVLTERILWVHKLVNFVKSPVASDDYGDFLAWCKRLDGFVTVMANKSK